MNNDSPNGPTLPALDNQLSDVSLQNPVATQAMPAQFQAASSMATQQSLNNQTIPMEDYQLTAEDVDLIEKAWVEKAKAIVRATHGNPYVQNKELHKIKAAYIKQRFSRDVKVSE